MWQAFGGVGHLDDKIYTDLDMSGPQELLDAFT